MATQQQKSVKEIFRDVLQENRKLLTNREALIERLEAQGANAMIREFTPVKLALQKNFGEKFLAADRDLPEEKRISFCDDIAKQLIQEGMQEKRAKEATEAFSYALGWTGPKITEAAPYGKMDTSSDETAETDMPLADTFPEERVSSAGLWTCICGAVNEGRFCVECGRVRGATEEPLPSPAPMPPMAPDVQQPPPANAPKMAAPQGISSVQAMNKKLLIGGLCAAVLLFGLLKFSPSEPKAKEQSQRVAENVQQTSDSPRPASQEKSPMEKKENEKKQPATTNPVPARQQTSPKKQNQSPSLQVSLNGICVGYDTNKVRALLGKEQKITDPYKSGHLRYQYPNLEVIITNGVVTACISKNAMAKTERGIHEGSTLQEVLAAYGNDYSKFDYDGATLYEYKMKSIQGKNCLQRFAIKNGRVDYVSCRVVDGN